MWAIAGGEAGRGGGPAMAEGADRLGQEEGKVGGQVWVTIGITRFIWKFLKTQLYFIHYNQF